MYVKNKKEKISTLQLCLNLAFIKCKQATILHSSSRFLNENENCFNRRDILTLQKLHIKNVTSLTWAVTFNSALNFVIVCMPSNLTFLKKKTMMYLKK